MFINDLIESYQVGFVHVRQVSDSTRRFFNLIEYAEIILKLSLLLALDVEMVFDSVH